MKNINKKQINNILKVGFYFLYTNILLMLPIALFNIDFNNLGNNQKTLYFIAIDLLLILILYFFNREDIKRDLFDFIKNIKEQMSIVSRYWAVGMIFMGLSNLIIQYFITGDIADNEEAIRDMMKVVPIYIVFATAIYAPIVEELVFRKMFKDIFGYTTKFVLLSGIIFGSLHVFAADMQLIDLVYILPYSSLGIAFAYAYTKTKNIFSTIAMHSIHNTTFVILQILLLL